MPAGTSTGPRVRQCSSCQRTATVDGIQLCSTPSPATLRTEATLQRVPCSTRLETFTDKLPPAAARIMERSTSSVLQRREKRRDNGKRRFSSLLELPRWLQLAGLWWMRPEPFTALQIGRASCRERV